MKLTSKNRKDKNRKKILVFSLVEPRYALYLATVERVIHAVEITPLPKAPEIVSGVINFHGEIIPVIDMRKRFNLPSRELEPDDQFIIARTSKRLVALIADSVEGIQKLDSKLTLSAEKVVPYADYLAGVAKTEDKLVLISDLDKFLSLDEERILEKEIEKVKK